MSRIWVLGAGQLGAMLRHAGQPLALDVRPVPFEPDTPVPETADDDLVTAEIEHWPDTPASRTLAAHPNFINRDVFPRLADRLPQKTLIDDLALATAPWRLLDDDTDDEALHDALGDKCLLKRRRGGYDGRGQLWLRRGEGPGIPDDWRGQAIAESAIGFDEEVSLVGARDRHGNKVFYPLSLNLHVQGALAASLAPLPRLAPLQAQAEGMLSELLDALDYVGVMAMECFRLGDDLLINELAPRVHNSGHWTQAGASISQFELHLRATADLPVPTPAIKGATAMVNLLGTERDDQWLTLPMAELFWYGKTVRPRRKVGHINLCAGERGDLDISLTRLESMLPSWYGDVIAWLRNNLNS